MREFIIAKEFNGKLEFVDFSIDNVRCIYEDDYYSNRVMRGKFILNESQLSLALINEPIREFSFSDRNGRILKGRITGSSFNDEYNSRCQELRYSLQEYSQWLRLSESRITSVSIRFSIPYIKDLSRDLMYSSDLYPEWLFRFGKKSFEISLNNERFEIDERVYCYEYKEPDSIMAKELILKINIPFEGSEISQFLTEYELKANDVMLILSFLFNNRMNFISYDAELLDEYSKIVITINHKYSNRLCGFDYCKDSDHEFAKLLNSENLSKLINNFVNAETKEKENITKLIQKFLTLGETEIFEPKFLSGFFLLEAISKIIINPKEAIGSESLIRTAIEKVNIRMETFETSHKRLEKGNTKFEWEISEYRNYLTHFNYQDKYDNQLMSNEYEKIVRICRKLILWIICPELTNWGFPNGRR